MIYNLVERVSGINILINKFEKRQLHYTVALRLLIRFIQDTYLYYNKNSMYKLFIIIASYNFTATFSFCSWKRSDQVYYLL